MKKILLALPLLLLGQTEREVQENQLLPVYGGEQEVRLWDGSRVDIATDSVAWEVDWADKSLKWAEAVGQSLYYAAVTGKKPGIILIYKDFAAAESNIYKCQTVCAKHGIILRVEEVEE